MKRFKPLLVSEKGRLVKILYEKSQKTDVGVKCSRVVTGCGCISQVKQKAACLLEMTTFLRKRMEEDDIVHHEIEKVFHELIR